MGTALAERLLGAGMTVLGYDIDPGKTERLVAMGGQAAASIADIAGRCDPILLAVFDTKQVEDVVEHGLLPVLGETSGKTVLCTSTCDPDRIAALGERAAGRGLNFLEAPVSGTSEQVRRGDGVGLIGGDPAAVAAAGMVLRVIYPRYFLVGGIGDGGRTKLAVNLILGLNRLALAEGLVFAERLGLDPRAFLEVARNSAAASQIMDVKGQKMLDKDFSPQGMARQTLKDAHLMLEKARELGQHLPALEVHTEVLEACVRAGEGARDNSIIIEEVRRRRTR
jgi:3-hydroxyisobutyrate dehydrogenase-like beta-hydroxyacid dehydrogenase